MSVIQEPPRADQQKAAGEVDKVAAYGDRLDEHLASVAVSQRRPFLIRQLAMLERRLNLAAGDEGAMDAFDYHLCMCEVSKRLNRCLP